MDPLLTQEKFDELARKLERMKQSRPQAAAEVARLALLGDFSENVEYQLAKGRLRGLNNGILRIEAQLNQADIIRSPKNTDTVQIGHTVTIEANGKKKIYQILGSSETDPERGIISHTSPLGAALLGHKVGEIVIVRIGGNDIPYRICRVE